MEVAVIIIAVTIVAVIMMTYNKNNMELKESLTVTINQPVLYENDFY